MVYDSPVLLLRRWRNTGAQTPGHEMPLFVEMRGSLMSPNDFLPCGLQTPVKSPSRTCTWLVPSTDSAKTEIKENTPIRVRGRGKHRFIHLENTARTDFGGFSGVANGFYTGKRRKIDANRFWGLKEVWGQFSTFERLENSFFFESSNRLFERVCCGHRPTMRP